MNLTQQTRRPTRRIVVAIIGVIVGLILSSVPLPDSSVSGAPADASSSQPRRASRPADRPSPSVSPAEEPARAPAPESDVAPSAFESDVAPSAPEPDVAPSALEPAAASALPDLDFPTDRVLAVDGEGNKFRAADPALIRDGDVWRLFTTETFWSNVPTWESTDMVTWTKTPDALPTLPQWVAQERDLTWAPDVVDLDGQWVLFFSSRVADTDRHCIGHAVAETAIGPFDAFDEPIVCELPEGGSIDPMVFIDGNDDPWLLWKVDANAIGRRSELRSQRLSADGTRLIGDYSTLLTIELGWEDPLIEQPEMVEVDGVLHLFYAANWYNQAAYQVGHAVCETVTGPCVRTTHDGGWLTTRDRVKGPGAVSVEVADGQLVGVYHGWIDGVATEGEFRSLIVEPITLESGRPVHTGTTAA